LDSRDDASSNLESDTVKPSITVLQRKIQKGSKNGLVEQIPSRTYRRKPETLNIMVYEMKSGGLTKKAKNILEKILFELKATELAGLLSECVMVKLGLFVWFFLMTRRPSRTDPTWK
jgi:hypothetical protein